MFYVTQFRIGLPDAEAEDKLVVEAGVREVHRAALIQAVEDVLIDFVAADMPEANEIQRDRRGEFEFFVCSDP